MLNKKFDSINIVPLIDVMLVLLVITLTTATFISQGILPVTPPSAKSSEPNSDLKATEIRVDKDGKIAFKERIVTLDVLKNELSKMDKNSSLAILADKDTKFSNFVNILDALKELEFKSVSIISDKDSKL